MGPRTLQPTRPRALRAAPLDGATPTSRTAIVGLGAGGHAKCVIEAIRSVFLHRVVAVADANPARVGESILNSPVVGVHQLEQLRADGVELAFLGIGGVGDATGRRAGGALLRQLGFTLPPIAHRTAVLAASARLESGAQVLTAAIINAEAHLLQDSLVNAGAIIGHDVVVGRCVHVSSGARIAGSVTIGDGAHVGTGAVVIQGRTIGEGAVVGAGAVVVDDVPAHTTVVGVPARPISTPGVATT